MNKKTTVIIVAIVVLLLLAGGVYKLMHHMQAASQSGESANPQTQSQSSMQPKSLSDFFSMAGSQKCTFSDSSNNSSGTVYVNNGKMRGDFQSQNEGKTESSHMLNDGTFVYMWTDGQQSGYKMSLAVVKQEAAQMSQSPANAGSAQPSQAVNFQQKSNYSCGLWSADSSLFTVPTNVTFTDYSSMMQGVTSHSAAPQTQEGGSTQNSIKANPAVCAQCNKAPAGNARNQCLTALHCQ
jgi:hypothetical protein